MKGLSLGDCIMLVLFLISIVIALNTIHLDLVKIQNTLSDANNQKTTTAEKTPPGWVGE
jgi:NADH:ubiquinone oxidoreductase subunit K